MEPPERDEHSRTRPHHRSDVSGKLTERERQLLASLEGRTVIGQATGILMERYQMSPQQSFAALQRISSETNTKLRVVAQQLVETRQLVSVPSREESTPGVDGGSGTDEHRDAHPETLPSPGIIAQPQLQRILAAVQEKADAEEGLKQAVAAALRAGASVEQVATASGVSARTVKDWNRELAGPPAPEPVERTGASSEGRPPPALGECGRGLGSQGQSRSATPHRRSRDGKNP
jgi:hypothetical protein